MSNTDKRRMDIKAKYNSYAAEKLRKLEERAVTSWTVNLPQFSVATAPTNYAMTPQYRN